MDLVFQETQRVIEAYRSGALGYQKLVHAVDALRANSDILEDKLDQFYATLEEINGVRIYENRQLTDDEKSDIAAILHQIEAAISEREKAKAADGC